MKNNIKKDLRLIDGIILVITTYIFLNIFAFIFQYSTRNIEISKNNNSYILSVIIQLSFIFSVFIVGYFRRVNFLEKHEFKRFITPKQLFIIILMTVVLLLFVMPFSTIISSMISKLHKNPLKASFETKTTSDLLIQLLLVAIMPAICEEIFFRAAFAKAARTIGFMFSVILTSIIFAMMHGSLQMFFYQFVASIIFMFVFFITKSIYPSMIMHAINNGFILVVSFIASTKKSSSLSTKNIPDLSQATWLSFILTLILFLIGLAILFYLYFLLIKQNKIQTKRSKQLTFRDFLDLIWSRLFKSNIKRRNTSILIEEYFFKLDGLRDYDMFEKIENYHNTSDIYTNEMEEREERMLENLPRNEIKNKIKSRDYYDDLSAGVGETSSFDNNLKWENYNNNLPRRFREDYAYIDKKDKIMIVIVIGLLSISLIASLFM